MSAVPSFVHRNLQPSSVINCHSLVSFYTKTLAFCKEIMKNSLKTFLTNMLKGLMAIPMRGFVIKKKNYVPNPPDDPTYVQHQLWTGFY